MKTFFILMTLVFTFALQAESNFYSCTTTVDYHDGVQGQSEFLVDTNSYSVNESDYNGYLSVIRFDPDIPEFKLIISKDNNILLDEEIALNQEKILRNDGIDYSLLCIEPAID